MIKQKENTSQNEKLIKVIIVGEGRVGKSSLLVRYVHHVYEPQNMTVGLDYRSKKIVYKDKLYKFELWDTAGQERFRAIVLNYFQLSKCGIVVFDLVQPQSLQKTQYWLNQLKVHCGQILTVLIGTKADLLDNYGSPEQISDYLAKINKKIKQIQLQFNCTYFQASAKTGQGIQQAFDYIIKSLLKKQDQQPYHALPQPEKISILMEPKMKGKGLSCCKN